jgi:hypothetical protein
MYLRLNPMERQEVARVRFKQKEKSCASWIWTRGFYLAGEEFNQRSVHTLQFHIGRDAPYSLLEQNKWFNIRDKGVLFQK